MPTYIFSKDSFLKFLEKYLKDDIAVVVSSDVTNLKKKKIESFIGEKDYFLVEFGIPCDVLRVDEDEFDELIKYTVVFVDKDVLSETGKKSLR